MGWPFALLALWAGCASAGETTARGMVRSLGEATLSSEISARIVELPYREGQTFKAGSVLAAFDCAALDASAAGAQADLRAAEAQLSTAREMAKMKAAGQRDVDLAEAKRDRAAADLEGIRVRVRSCALKAPFDGAVVERPANLHEVIAPSTPVLRIVDQGRLEVELIVPSRWLRWLEPGTPATFQVDETGRAQALKVDRIGAAVDPVSQTVKIYALFDGAHPGIVPGMSGTATLTAPQEGP